MYLLHLCLYRWKIILYKSGFYLLLLEVKSIQSIQYFINSHQSISNTFMEMVDSQVKTISTYLIKKNKKTVSLLCHTLLLDLSNGGVSNCMSDCSIWFRCAGFGLMALLPYTCDYSALTCQSNRRLLTKRVSDILLYCIISIHVRVTEYQSIKQL